MQTRHTHSQSDKKGAKKRSSQETTTKDKEVKGDKLENKKRQKLDPEAKSLVPPPDNKYANKEKPSKRQPQVKKREDHKSDQEMSEEESKGEVQSPNMKGLKSKIRRGSSNSSGLQAKGLEQQIRKFEANDPLLSKINFKGLQGVEPCDSSICQICFQDVLYPEKEWDDKVASNTLTINDKEAKLLYQLCYCQHCSVPVHWNCLGEAFKMIEFIKNKNTFYLFECEKCKAEKETRNLKVKCIACNQSGGLLKLIEGKKDDEKQKEASPPQFIHQICAMCFPSIFYLKSIKDMRYKIMPKYAQEGLLKVDLDLEECKYCQDDTGLQLKCNEPSCNESAHAYCLMKYLKNSFQEKTNFCHCLKTSEGNGMVMCEYCSVWYHSECLPVKDLGSYRESDEEYLCQKCASWKNHLKDTLLEIIYQWKDCKQWFQNERTAWSFDLINYGTPQVMKVENKFFEHIVLAKAWYQLHLKLLKNTCTVELINAHQQMENRIIISLVRFDSKLKNKITNDSKSLKEHEKEIDQEVKAPLQEFDEDLNPIQENIEQNQKTLEQINKIKESVIHIRLMNEPIVHQQRIKNRIKIIKKLTKLLVENEKKPTMSEIDAQIMLLIKNDMKASPEFKILQKLYEQASKWKQQVLNVFEKSKDDSEKVKQDLIQIKDFNQGLFLIEKRVHYFQKEIDKKITTEAVATLINQGKKLKLSVDEELKSLAELNQQVKKWDQIAHQISKSHVKPVKKMFEHLQKVILLPLKSDNADEVLKTFKRSAEWESKAQSFIVNHLNEESKMDIDEGDDLLKWSSERAELLLEQAVDKQDDIYYDQSTFKDVQHKIELIKHLKKSLPEVLSGQHDIQKLKQYIVQLKDIENVNFKNLESLQQQVNTSANNPDFPIQLPFDMKMMFEAKVQIAKDLKNEFQEILQKHADKFTKTLGTDLKKIVNKASKDHSIEMKTEQRIVDNIPHSEEWFIQTFERLKKVVGKALNSVDFKNYQQLAQALTEEKDCDNLLKYSKAELLVGAAKNLWKSLSGVKWLFGVRKVMAQNKQDLSKIAQLDQQAIDLKLSNEILQEDNKFKDILERFDSLKASSREYYDRFGTHKKCLDTLDSYKDNYDELLEEIGKYEEKFSLSKDELMVLQKMRTYTNFSKDYAQNQLPTSKLSQDKALMLQTLAREKHIPDDIPILRKLNESVARFEKFRKEYADYRRFRERMRKQNPQALVINMIDAKFSKSFIRRILDQASKIEIEMTPDYFSKAQLEEDLIFYHTWRDNAQQIIGALEQNEESLNDETLSSRFQDLKCQINQLAVFDKEMFLKIQGFDWLFNCIQNLNTTQKQDLLSIGSWEALIKQADVLSNSMINVKEHSVYQRLLWEVDQAKSVMDFCSNQKALQKSLAAKFNQEKSHSYSFFRNKHQPTKLHALLLIAQNSKIDLLEEKRCLENWIKDYEKIRDLFNSDKLYEDYHYEKLKDVAKQMYFSPIEYGDFYYDLKNKLDSAEQIRLNLKQIVQEYQFTVIQRQKESKGTAPTKRLRYSRISHDLRQYHKECKIKGIREIETALNQVGSSQEKLKEISLLLSKIESVKDKQEVEKLILNAKKLYSQVEIDMESQELEVKRQLFEEDFRLLMNPEFNKKIQIEEFKDLEIQYEQVKNSLKDEQIHAKYLEFKKKVHDYLRRINRLENKEELEQITYEVNENCAFIDFTQILTDKHAEFILGKRKEKPSTSSKLNLDMNDDEQVLGLGFVERRKSSEESKSSVGVERSNSAEASSSSSNESSSGSSSGSGSDSSDSESGSGSESDSSSEEESKENEQSKSVKGSQEESSESDEEDEESSKENLAKNRSRRNIVPNVNSDFIYDKSTQKTQKAVHQSSEAKPDKEPNEKRKKKDEAHQLKKEKKREEKERLKKLQREEKRRQEEAEQQQQSQKKSLFNKFRNQNQQNYGVSVEEIELQYSLNNIKTKIRDQQRNRMKDALELLSKALPALDRDIINNLIDEIETEIFTKHPDVDHYYKKRMNDTLENIKCLQKFKDAGEMILLKRQISIQKLLQSNPNFLEGIQNVQKRINEKKQQRREFLQEKKLEEKRFQQQMIKSNDVSIPVQQKIKSNLYNQNNDSKGDDNGKKGVMKNLSDDSDIDDDEDDLESVESNPAQFSDEEMVDENQSRNNSMNELLQQNQNKQKGNVEYDPSMVGQVSGGSDSNNTWISNYNIAIQKYVQYNPYEVLDKYQSKFRQKKSAEPILYDPLRYKLTTQTNSSKDKNVAPAGSLLKVWEGQLEITKDQIFSCQFLSTQDIQLYQSLPELPTSLALKGKAKISEVATHFIRQKKDKRLIKGWVIRKNHQNQENSDKYTKLFDELDQSQKAALFNVFQSVNFYLIPVTQRTIDFCNQMGIHPEHLPEKIPNPQENYSSEETHCFAFIAQIKAPFNSKINYLNPDVLLHRDQPLHVAYEKPSFQQEQGYSPISSDDEGTRQSKIKSQILQKVKHEEQIPIKTQDPEQVVKPHNEVDIDEIISGFKNNNYSIKSIQEKLLPIIQRGVKGEDEQRLTEFLKQLITTHNSQQESFGQVKQEPMMNQSMQNSFTSQQPLMQPYNQQNFSPMNMGTYGAQAQSFQSALVNQPSQFQSRIPTQQPPQQFVPYNRFQPQATQQLYNQGIRPQQNQMFVQQPQPPSQFGMYGTQQYPQRFQGQQQPVLPGNVSLLRPPMGAMINPLSQIRPPSTQNPMQFGVQYPGQFSSQGNNQSNNK